MTMRFAAAFLLLLGALLASNCPIYCNPLFTDCVHAHQTIWTVDDEPIPPLDVDVNPGFSDFNVYDQFAGTDAVDNYIHHWDGWSYEE
jgi:hypothetical protein